MNSRADSTMEISFGASAAFDSVANVAASNLAFRLGYKNRHVSRLQAAVDVANEALGNSGTTKMVLTWSDGPITVALKNSNAKITKPDVQDLRDILTELGATAVSLRAGSIKFTISN